MSSLVQNLEYLMKKQGLSANQLQEKTGVTQSTTSRILSGETKNPRADALKKYADYFGVSVIDLQYSNLAVESNISPNFESVAEWDDSTPLDDDEVGISFYKDITFACGYGAVNDDVTHETRKLRMGKRTLSNLGVMPENAFAVTARDDSMTPYVQDGDTIYIDKGRKEVKDGRIFAIRFGELCLCKRLYRLPDGGVRIVSDNAAEFPEQVATKQQISDGEFEVIGWVWSVSHLERW